MLAAVDCGHAAHEAVELELIGAACKSYFHSTVADDIQECRLAGYAERVPEGCDDRSGTQPDA